MPVSRTSSNSSPLAPWTVISVTRERVLHLRRCRPGASRARGSPRACGASPRRSPRPRSRRSEPTSSRGSRAGPRPPPLSSELERRAVAGAIEHASSMSAGDACSPRRGASPGARERRRGASSRPSRDVLRLVDRAERLDACVMPTRACAKAARRSSVVSPMPRAGVLMMRRRSTSLRGFTSTRRYAIASLISARS